jgi:hypothetical protein
MILRSMHVRVRVAVLAALCLCARPVTAQEPTTRAELLERQRAEKAAQAATYQPGLIEKGLLYVDEHRILDRLGADLDGLYPRFGGFPTGGGWGIGPGYKRHLPGRFLRFDASGALSFRGYKVGEVLVRTTRLAGERLVAEGGAVWRDFTQEDFFGLGPDSSRSTRTNYRLQSSEFYGQIAWRVRPWLTLAERIASNSINVLEGTDTRMPPTQALFTDEEVPGLDDEPRLVSSDFTAEIDYRDQPANPRAGGRYFFRHLAATDRRGNDYSFDRYEGEVLQVFPIFDKKRNFAVRARLSESDPRDGARVPFYVLPYIGGRDSIRGFREYRFRDNASWLLNGEYRWEAFSGLDLALFYDTGGVASTVRRLSVRDRKHTYGVGFRFNTNRRVLLRADVGMGGGEGTRLFVIYRAAF